MYNPKSHKAEEFINHEEVLDTLKYAQENKNNIELIDKILKKAKLLHLHKNSKKIITEIELYFLRHYICQITV